MGIEFSAKAFEASHPFGFVVDGEGRIGAFGRALRRWEGIVSGRLVSECFELVRPRDCEHINAVECRPSNPVELHLIGGSLVIRGHLVELEGGSGRAFLGAPLVRSIEEVGQQRLQLADFTPADATPDLLMAHQSTTGALEDARKLTAKLGQAVADAQRATQAKARFLAMVSHEIRTPLNGFGSMIDLLRAELEDAHQLDLLSTMDDCAGTLARLVDDLLDVSRFEAKGVDLRPEPCELASLLQATLANFEAQAAAKGVGLRLELEGELPPAVMVDPGRLRQVVANLVGNAVKFTASGEVLVWATLPEGEEFVLEVRDTGVGIPESERGGLFQPFVQVDSSVTRKFAGTGLGLTISREIAEAMGGEVRLITSGADGSTFRVRLPLEPCELDDEGAPDDDGAEWAPVDGCSVLVVEDDQVNRLIMRRMLDKLGVSASFCDSGITAVERVATEAFDLVLMDLMMPGLSGIEATQRIRASGVTAAQLPIVGCSASTFETDRQQAEEAGMQGFLAKPVRLDSLQTAIARFARRGD